MTDSHDFMPTCELATLHRRAELLRSIRHFFDQENFIEVETPLLSADVVVDLHIEPVAVSLDGHPFWLQTSPEFSMKRLLTAGAERIYQITKAFRSGERGAMHNPEFTMLEWYRVADDYAAGRELLAQFARSILGCESVEQMTYQNAFQVHAGFCPFRIEIEELKSTTVRLTGLTELGSDAAGESRDEMLNVILSEVVEPKLGVDRPQILYDFPASQAALAKVRDEEYPVAERFELYDCGVELANGYHELLDADELMRRNRATNEVRQQHGKQQLPTESRLLDAMRYGLPSCCGVAVGIDRLAMVLLEKSKIDEVIAFPLERA